MELTPRLRLMNWIAHQSLTGLPENDLLRGFCERCRAHGLELSRAMVIIDTLHPVFEGRGFRWSHSQTNESDSFEYGSSSEGGAVAENWRRSTFYHLLETGGDELLIDLSDCEGLDFNMIEDLSAKGHKHFLSMVHRFGEAGTMGQMDCFYSTWVTRRDEGFGEQGLAALRELVPVLGLAVKSAAQAEVARTLGRVYLGRDASEQVLRGRIARGVTERINAVLWFSDLRGSTSISESIEPGQIIPFLNDYAQASIDAIHDAGGEVLKLIGDGVLAMFTNENMAVAKRTALRAEHHFRRNMAAVSARRAAEGVAVTTAHVGLHVGEVFYGNIGSDDRLDFTVVGPAVNEVSRIASMCRSVDRELLTSEAFRTGLDATGRNYLVSTGRYALRGIGRAQDLYTLDPDIASDEVVAGKYERYLGS
ncbi:adenylate/guanylate cyclase domain-containing protein [Bradyrhizobium sp. JYMT SZCCT0428]|uniref:adenylate/guanylate cyclase domain-containing protein n=1 Tax=Bradyrhizobium sp. JYMT SZCCT0428 TaxID=2807673 RepID=UPI001BA58565|nr:adenylate/guanylate cyclase domain-containing protein [Bradyrhizobium sp. JYMT SZCCT0428]MBR1155783.1 adenylate/guanylate cyclase domain-containing protein [Bradyrhizobium sp. JYMT SZCCT0428]